MSQHAPVDPRRKPEHVSSGEEDFDRIEAHLADTDARIAQLTTAVTDLATQVRTMMQARAESPQVQEPATEPPHYDGQIGPARTPAPPASHANFQFPVWRENEVNPRDYWGTCRRAARAHLVPLPDAFLVSRFEAALTASGLSWASRYLGSCSHEPTFDQLGEAFCRHFEAASTWTNTAVLLQAIPCRRAADVPTQLAEFRRMAHRSTMSEQAKLQALMQWLSPFRVVTRHLLATQPATLDDAVNQVLVAQASETAANARRETTTSGGNGQSGTPKGGFKKGNNNSRPTGNSHQSGPGNSNNSGSRHPSGSGNHWRNNQTRQAQVHAADASGPTQGVQELLDRLDEDPGHDQ